MPLFFIIAICCPEMNSGFSHHRSGLSNHQIIFPDMRFECSGVAVKWTISGYSHTGGRGPYVPHLQIWSPQGNGLYTIKNTSALSSVEMITHNIYEQVINPPLPFEPGDVIGAFQPWFNDSNVQLHIEPNQPSLFYTYSTYNEGYTSPQYVQFSLSNATISVGVLLVSVEISEEIHSHTVTFHCH